MGMKPIDEAGVLELARLYRSRWRLTKHEGDLLESLMKRIYAEGKLAGVLESGQELRTTLDNFKAKVKV